MIVCKFHVIKENMQMHVGNTMCIEVLSWASWRVYWKLMRLVILGVNWSCWLICNSKLLIDISTPSPLLPFPLRPRRQEFWLPRNLCCSVIFCWISAEWSLCVFSRRIHIPIVSHCCLCMSASPLKAGGSSEEEEEAADAAVAAVPAVPVVDGSEKERYRLKV